LGSDKSQANSGVAMEMRRRQGLINLEPVFDNFDLAQRVLGDTVIEIINKNDIYTPDEISEMVGEIKDSNGNIIDPNAVIAFMKTKKGGYSTTVAQQDNSPTIRAMDFQNMLTAIKEAGIPVPPEMIVGASDWAFKDEWISWNKAQQQMQQSMPTDMQVPMAPQGQMPM